MFREIVEEGSEQHSDRQRTAGIGQVDAGEARMASAQLLKITHGVGDRVKVVNERIQEVGSDVQDVGETVRDVDNKVQDIGTRYKASS